jgi:signal peptidase II
MKLIPGLAVVRSRGVRWAAAGMTVCVFAVDQGTKSLVVAGRVASGSSSGRVISHVANQGASGGIASGYPILVTLAVFTVTALTVVLTVRATSRAAALCLAVVLGGALGNLTDRLFRSPGLGRGGVVDWIHLSIAGGIAFDLADLAIVLGVVGTIAAMLVAGPARKDGRDRRPHPAIGSATA